MSENKITFPVKLASNNPQSFGIVDATEISGHRSVDTISDLYSISDPVLSVLKDGSDAIGQEWFVVSEDCKYRLDNWENRKSVSGWTKLPKQEFVNTKQSVSEKDQPNGYAGLDSNGKLPIEKTYGDTATVVETETYESLPATGLSGVIYYVSNTSAQYKWSGSAYIDITDGADNAKKNETSIFDCSNGTSTKYYSSLSEAINVVPPAYRTSNRIISYLSTENSTTSAMNYQYHGIDSTTWTDLTKWEHIPNQADLAEIRSDLSENISELEGKVDDIPQYEWITGGFDTVYMVYNDDVNYSHSSLISIYNHYLSYSKAIRFVVYYDENKNIVDYSDGGAVQSKLNQYSYVSIVTADTTGEIKNKQQYTSLQNSINGINKSISDLSNFSIKNINKIGDFYYTKGGFNTVDFSFDNNNSYIHTELIDTSFNTLDVQNGGIIRFVVYYDNNKNYTSYSTDSIDTAMLLNSSYAVIVFHKNSITSSTFIYNGLNTALSNLYFKEGLTLNWVSGGFDAGNLQFVDNPNYHRTQLINIEDSDIRLSFKESGRFVVYLSDINTITDYDDIEISGISDWKMRTYKYIVLVYKTYSLANNYQDLKVFPCSTTFNERLSNVESEIESNEKIANRYRYIMFTFCTDYDGLFLLGSHDLRLWHAIKKEAVYKPHNKFFTDPVEGDKVNMMRDPSFIKIGDWFYLTYTICGFYRNSGYGNTIGLCRTKDLTHFEELPNLVITDPDGLDLSNGWSWASDFLCVNNQVYIVCSSSPTSDHVEASFHHYICEFDTKTNTIGTCFKTNILDIDCHIYYLNGNFYSIGSANFIWKSSTLLSNQWVKINQNEIILSYEGQFMLALDNGKYFLLAQDVKNPSLEKDSAHLYYQIFDNIEGVYGERHQLQYDDETREWLQSMAVEKSEAYHPTIYDRNGWLWNNNKFFTD